MRAGRRAGGGADLAEAVVDWVSSELGRSSPSIDQYAKLLGGPGAMRPLDLKRLVEDDLIAVLVWLVAGLVAVVGGGDVRWLEQLR